MKIDEINYIINGYLPEALRTWTPSKIHGDPETYLRLGYISEVGELADVYKQRMRDGGSLNRARLIEELGDVLWYAAVGYHAVFGIHRPEHLAGLGPASGTVEALAGAVRRSAPEILAAAVAAVGFAGLNLAEVGKANNKKLARRLAAGTVTAETREEVE